MVWKIMQIVEGFIHWGRGWTIDSYFKSMLTSTHVNFPFSLACLSENSRYKEMLSHPNILQIVLSCCPSSCIFAIPVRQWFGYFFSQNVFSNTFSSDKNTAGLKFPIDVKLCAINNINQGVLRGAMFDDHESRLESDIRHCLFVSSGSLACEAREGSTMDKKMW